MRRHALLAGVFLLLAPGSARAQSATPQAQFDFGLSEMMAGRYASGCPALAESYRLDPRPGVLFTLAECENKWGRAASALAHYQAYIDGFARMRDEEKARQGRRDQVAVTQRDALRAVVPDLSIALPSAAPTGTTVSCDGVALSAASLGVPLPVDPGEHVVVAKTPDGASHEARVSVARGEHRSFVVDLTVLPPPAPATTPAAAPAPKGRRAIPAGAWIAGGVGVAGLIAGGVGGAIALSEKSTIDSSCNAQRQCSAAGLSAASQANTAGLVSDVGFAVAGAGAVTAVILLLASPSRVAEPSIALGPHGGYVALHATW